MHDANNSAPPIFIEKNHPCFQKKPGFAGKKKIKKG